MTGLVQTLETQQCRRGALRHENHERRAPELHGIKSLKWLMSQDSQAMRDYFRHEFKRRLVAPHPASGATSFYELIVAAFEAGALSTVLEASLLSGLDPRSCFHFSLLFTTLLEAIQNLCLTHSRRR